MKCPKCQYLGFDTGERCRNCGYDFSLAAGAAASGPVDLPLRVPEPAASGPANWIEQFDHGLEIASTLPRPSADPLAPLPLDTMVAPAAAGVRSAGARGADGSRSARTMTPPLPLFPPAADTDDEPLIKLPAAPRPPLAVRRTPDKPRLRGVSKPPREAPEGSGHAAPVGEPILAFPADPAAEAPLERHASAAVTLAPPLPAAASGPGRRLLSALLDHAILGGVDVTVVYLTLKVAALSLDQWTVLPTVPLLAFLLLVKAAYFYAFTLVGGQTVGKMACGIRVVSDDGREVDPVCAVRRTLAGALSLATLGLGFMPVLLAADRRALHDRVARTRVIAS